MCQLKKMLVVEIQGNNMYQVAGQAGRWATHLGDPAMRQSAPAFGSASAVKAILEAAQRDLADLIVCPASRRHPVLERVAPSCATQIARTSRMPVLLVNRMPATEYRTVVVATDFSQASIDAAKTAVALAPFAHFIFLHAHRLPDERLMRELELPFNVIAAYCESGRLAALQRLDVLRARFESGIRSSSCVVRPGNPGRVLEEFARSSHADLIVIGKPKGNAWAWRIGGSCVPGLISRPYCDVLLGAIDGIAESGRRRARERLAAFGKAAFAGGVTPRAHPERRESSTPEEA